MPIKIVLVNPGSDIGSSYDGPKRTPYPPLSLLSLSTFLKLKGHNAYIKILDGQIAPIEKIIKIISKISPKIVGISPFSPTYWDTLKIARFSKKIGAKVILGGHHAASLAKEILLLRGSYSDDYCVDCVVQNDGEEAFYRIVKGESFKKIPNVIFLHSPGVVKINKVKTLNFDNLPIADRDLINLEPYFKTQRALNIFSKIGCEWRGLTGSGCIFCSRMHDKLMRSKSPDSFWKEINFLRKKYTIDTILDGRDDFLDDND